jgi:preprotein translocase subunit YajC
MINPAWAQAAPGGAPPAVMQFAPLVLIFVVFYFLLIRPQQQKAKEHKTLLANLKRNDDVITSGGLYGKVMALTDKVVTLEIAPNVRVRVDRPQIASVAKSGPPEESKDTKEKEKDKTK